MVPIGNWKWFGDPAHLCVGAWCQFHLATKVGPYLISTVGAYYPPHVSESERPAKPTEIGIGRLYETMVFKAGKPCETKGCACGMPAIDGSELDSKGYNTAGDATKGHLTMCRKFANRKRKPK